MATPSKKVYVTPDALFAFVDRAHPKHEQAAAYFRFFSEEQYKLFSDFVSVGEVYRKIYIDISPSLAKDFLRTIALSNINIIYPEDSDMKASLKALVNFQSTELTFHEALIAVLAERRDIGQICTFSYLHALFGQSIFYLPL